MASFLDATRFLASSSGTGTFTVSAAVTGYQTPALAGAVNGATYYYRAESADLSQWEVGIGVYTVSGTTLTRATILFNSLGTTAAVNFSAAPQVAITVLAEAMGPLALTGVGVQANPSNPTGTASSSGVMMGVGGTCTATTKYSSRLKVELIGVAISSSGPATAYITLKYGTGTAPSNGAAFSGTTIGINKQCASGGTGYATPFTVAGIVNGLTPGTPYWFDIEVITGGVTMTIVDIDFNAMEF